MLWKLLVLSFLLIFTWAKPALSAELLPNCPRGFELKKNGNKTGCFPEGSRGPVSFKVADDAQLEALRNYDIKSEFKGVNVFPMQKEEQINYRGWILGSNVTTQPLVKIPKEMKTLPAPYTFYGQQKCHFARFLNSPEAVVQQGDMLIYIENSVQAESSSLYMNMVEGMVHTGLAMRDREGNLMRVEAPYSSSEKGFNRRSYHLLRLRPLPKEITSNEDLEAWLKDPEKREKLKAFLTERNYRLAAINYYANRLFEAGFDYGSNKSLRIATDQEKIRDLIHRAETKDVKFICSELTATPIILSGVSRPAMRSAKQTLMAMDEFLKTTAAKEGISKDKALKNGLDNLALEYAGVSNKTVAAIINFFLPKWQAGWNEAIQKIMNAPKESMEAELKKAPPALREYLEKKTIGPSDFVKSIYDGNSDYFYVGTYIEGGIAEIRNKSTIEGQLDRTAGVCP